MNILLRFSLAAAVALGFWACDSSSSGSDDSEDCTLSEEGIKVLYPSGGETFSIGDSITVRFVANDPKASSFYIRFMADSSADGVDLPDGSAGPSGPDGSECSEVKVGLSADKVVASENAFIRVMSYGHTVIRGDSKAFTVKE